MTCQVCRDPDRQQIEMDLIDGVPTRTIANRYARASRSSIERHRKNHMPEHLLKARETHEIATAEELLARIVKLESDAQRIGRKAEKASDFNACVGAVREQTRIVGLLAMISKQAIERGDLDGGLVSSGFIDSVMERAQQLRQGKSRCAACQGSGWLDRSMRPPLLLEAGQNGLSDDAVSLDRDTGHE